MNWTQLFINSIYLLYSLKIKLRDHCFSFKSTQHFCGSLKNLILFSILIIIWIPGWPLLINGVLLLVHNWACSFLRALWHVIRPKLFLLLVDIILFKHTWGSLARYILCAPHTLARNISVPIFLVKTNNWHRFVPTFKAVFVIHVTTFL